MAVRDIVEGTTSSDVLVSIWFDEETNEVFIQYGYVDLSLPKEDFTDVLGFMVAAEEKLTESETDQ